MGFRNQQEKLENELLVVSCVLQLTATSNIFERQIKVTDEKIIIELILHHFHMKNQL